MEKLFYSISSSYLVYYHTNCSFAFQGWFRSTGVYSERTFKSYMHAVTTNTLHQRTPASHFNNSFNLQRVALTLSLLHTAHDNTIKHLATYKVVQHLVWLPALRTQSQYIGCSDRGLGCVHKCCLWNTVAQTWRGVCNLWVHFSFLAVISLLSPM